mmetsp:Transcript_16522/g.24813  ORF Transcript_16522/g.24813 Transcript_16522/m.24813 type:complete len:325 (-) Transcript_16522:225-1199(-)
MLFFFCLTLNTKVYGLSSSSYLQIHKHEANLKYLHRKPDVFEAINVLEKEECDLLIAKAQRIGVNESPVAYAGWTSDISELLRLWISGPAIWMGLIGAVLNNSSRIQAAITAITIFIFSSVLAWGITTTWALKFRKSELQTLRTSKSVALSDSWIHDDTAHAQRKLYTWLAEMLQVHPDSMEALTLIRYEPGERLAPHFDANRDYAIEDSDRGGQTLATCLIYLTDSNFDNGGYTSFTSLDLRLQPKKGSACIFFPAAIDGTPDQRLEHAGEPPLYQTKWIARIWVHQRTVPSPFGLHPENLNNLGPFSFLQEAEQQRTTTVVR